MRHMYVLESTCIATNTIHSPYKPDSSANDIAAIGYAVLNHHRGAIPLIDTIQ
jgi:hypothetical protein